MTDWHCHLLPGVDDGVVSMAEAIAILTEYDRLGICDVWLTPHIMEDVPNAVDDLRLRYDELCAAWTGKARLHLAAENMLDGLFKERFAAGDFLTIGERGDMVLVETSYFSGPMNLQGVLGGIMSKGYFPLLAHPERYMYMDHDDYRELRECRVKFQLNLLSFYGWYGTEVREKAVWLLEQGMVDCVATDVHRIEQLHVLATKKLPEKILKMLQPYINPL